MISGMEKQLKPFLRRHTKIGFDSNVLIVLVEPNIEYGKIVRAIFESLDILNKEIWTSVLTIPEVLIKPMRDRKSEIVVQYEKVLYNSPFSFAEVRLATSRTATLLGAHYNLASHDALILASLMEAGITGFITADKDFKGVQEVEVLLVG